jgi:farnesyl-diphosphate farnesyltransferase
MIFRIIDTIEDSDVLLKIKKQGFDKFLDVLNRKSYEDISTQDCRKFLLSKLNYTYEKELLENMDAVIKIFYSTPIKQRKAILRWGTEMSKGMLSFQTKKIKSFKDQDDYSFYVAGVVGYLFNDLFFYNKIITKSKRDHLMEYAKRYGLGLQKVNILRDVAYDIPQNRFYWPVDILKKHSLDYSTLCLDKYRKSAMQVLDIMIHNALIYLNDGLYYVMSLPRSSPKVRVFCLIPLFMAIESFTKCIGNENVFIKGMKVKISRAQVKNIVKKSYLYSISNTLLRKWYNKLMKAVGKKYKIPIH